MQKAKVTQQESGWNRVPRNGKLFLFN